MFKVEQDQQKRPRQNIKYRKMTKLLHNFETHGFNKHYMQITPYMDLYYTDQKNIQSDCKFN